MIQRMIRLLKDAAQEEMNHISTWSNTAIPSYTAWIESSISFRPYHLHWDLGSSEWKLLFIPESYYI